MSEKTQVWAINLQIRKTGSKKNKKNQSSRAAQTGLLQDTFILQLWLWKENGILKPIYFFLITGV